MMRIPAILLFATTALATPALAQTGQAATDPAAPTTTTADPAAAPQQAPAYDPAVQQAPTAAPAPTYDPAAQQAPVSDPATQQAPAPSYDAGTDSDPGYSFTGLRVEFLGGFSRQQPRVRTDGPVLTTSRALRHSGLSAGIQGGFDAELGPVVVGAFGGYALLTSQGCGTLTGRNEGCLRPQAEAEGGARVGFQARSRFLAYAKGSYVNTRVQTSVRNGPQVFNSHINKDGWRVGGGAEFALTPNAYLKAEYNYTRTERFDAQPYGFQNTDINYRNHSVLAGFGVRF